MPTWFPPNPPYICEAITDSYGTWYNYGSPDLSSIALSTLFDATKEGNQFSIVKHQTGYNPGMDGRLYYELHDTQDFSRFEMMVFGHLNGIVQTDSVYHNPFLVWLEDENGNRSIAQQFISLGVWVDKAFYMENFIPQPETPDFDISRVKRIWFANDGSSGTDVWPKFHCVDWLFLYGEEERFELTILSEPSGKEVSVNNIYQITPAPYDMPAGDYTVSTDPIRFREWEDGSTNPVRQLTVDADMTIMAYYTDDGDGDGDPTPQLPQFPTAELGVAVALFIAGLLL